jgi:plastocyanin
MRKAATIFTVAALAAFGAAACGDDDEDEAATQAATETQATDTAGGAAAGETQVEVSAPASGEFAFDQKTLTTKAGTSTFTFDNPATLSHDFIIESEDGSELGRTDLISESSDTVTVDLQPGTYTYYCDVPGHREGGMEGTLTVQ